jgi:hypothetical protein
VIVLVIEGTGIGFVHQPGQTICMTLCPSDFAISCILTLA